MSDQPANTPTIPTILGDHPPALPCVPGRVPIWKTFSCGPDQIVGWMPFDPLNPNARYFA